MTRLIAIDTDDEYVQSGKNMRAFFLIGLVATVAMVIMVLVSGVTWFAILELVVAAGALVLAALNQVERESYRFRKQLRRAKEA